ncbi:MAG: hypothetical protein JWO38_4471 [Gemmataceae bacterium]|nr:hypothetical protein [Gemmataceae bacterium]
MPMRPTPRWTRGCATALLLACWGATAVAQPPAPTPAPTAPAPRPRPAPAPPVEAPDDGGLTVRDTSAGYIDNPLPLDQVFLRADAGFGFTRPNRAEFFYAQGRPGGPGLPLPERRVDFTDLSAGVEKVLAPRLSVFAAVPVRFLDPQVNANATGLGDVWAGFKYVACRNESSVVTFQMTAYAPSGNPSLGLGTNHATLEPALLAAHSPADRLTLLGELRAWTPLGGTDFAGEVLRYGIGARYDLVRTERFRAAPLVELVGWEVLGGKQSGLTDGGVAVTDSAAGTSVLNLKVGCRFDWGRRAGLYVGYGRALTGERWYSDVVRVEARWLY